jgi:hypothetical protein
VLLIIMDGSGEKRPKPAGAGMGRRRPMIELEGDSHQPTNKIP